MIYNVENILIPENYIRLTMKTKEFDRLIETEFSENELVYRYKGARYLFMGEDFVVEEGIGKNYDS
jgi:hypothetical protein